MSRHAVSLRIEGRVQGVGFRWWVVETATGLGLAGWVRNRRDGTVEVLAIGEQPVLDALAEACRGGPAGAVVRAVEVYSAGDDGSAGFEQRATV
jgi:acylphosphatase